MFKEYVINVYHYFEKLIINARNKNYIRCNDIKFIMYFKK